MAAQSAEASRRDMAVGVRADAGPAPVAAFACAWNHRRLILRLARREIEARYRGSILGLLWSIVSPLLMLSVYTFVFSTVFRGRWSQSAGTTGEFALLLFSGLIVVSMFIECVNRAPSLMLENGSYIKRVIFPLEILPWVVLAVAAFNAAVSLVALAAFYVVVLGPPPATAMLFPVLLIPLALTTLGFTWFLASIGVFLRDIRQMIGIATTMLVFVSPVFYPLEAVPEPYRRLIRLNPLTWVLEDTKAVLFWGRWPSWSGCAAQLVFGVIVMSLGFWWFMRTRKAFADVV
jgi:lipopolysaccharide transport system permease protein